MAQNEVIKTPAPGEVESLEEYTNKLDMLIEDFSKLYQQAVETSDRARIRTRLVQGLADGLSH